jgi:hypothetical protein
MSAGEPGQFSLTELQRITVHKKNALHQQNTSVPHKNTTRINSQVPFRIADKLQLFRYYIVSDDGLTDELERI